MKIHGTAKGGAISKKDFGAAFGGGGGSAGIDDTGLVALYKFDESSQSVPNSSQSDDSGGTNFNATCSNAVTNVTGHFGDCFSFNGTNANIALYDDADIAKSQWNWLHDGTSWSVSYWIRRVTINAYVRLYDQLYGLTGSPVANGVTNYWYDASLEPYGNGNFIITNDSTGSSASKRALDTTFSSAFWNDTEWRFYTHTMDWSPASNNLVSTLDNATTVYGDKSAYAPTTGNSVGNMTGMSNAGGTGHFNNAEIQQLTFWNVVIDQDVKDALWNDGAGRAFY